MKPDKRNYKKDFEYLRELKKKSGLTNNEIAAAMDVGLSTVKKNLSSNAKYQAPYYFQFMLECLAMDAINQQQASIDKQRKEITGNLIENEKQTVFTKTP